MEYIPSKNLYIRRLKNRIIVMRVSLVDHVPLTTHEFKTEEELQEYIKSIKER